MREETPIVKPAIDWGAHQERINVLEAENDLRAYAWEGGEDEHYAATGMSEQILIEEFITFWTRYRFVDFHVVARIWGVDYNTFLAPIFRILQQRGLAQTTDVSKKGPVYIFLTDTGKEFCAKWITAGPLASSGYGPEEEAIGSSEPDEHGLHVESMSLHAGQVSPAIKLHAGTEKKQQFVFRLTEAADKFIEKEAKRTRETRSEVVLRALIALQQSKEH